MRHLGIANIASAARAILTGVAIGMLHRPALAAAPSLLIIVAYALDGCDGPLARRCGECSPRGAVIDVLADRAMEGMLLSWFASQRLVPTWMWAGLTARILLADVIRLFALRRGLVSNGEIWVPARWRPLLQSRISRGGYGCAKAVFFSLLALPTGTIQTHYAISALAVTILAWSIVRLCPLLATYRHARCHGHQARLLGERIEAVALAQTTTWLAIADGIIFGTVVVCGMIVGRV